MCIGHTKLLSCSCNTCSDQGWARLNSAGEAPSGSPTKRAGTQLPAQQPYRLDVQSHELALWWLNRALILVTKLLTFIKSLALDSGDSLVFNDTQAATKSARMCSVSSPHVYPFIFFEAHGSPGRPSGHWFTSQQLHFWRWESSRKWPKYSGPYTHVGNPDGIPGSWVWLAQSHLLLTLPFKELNT